MGIKKILFCKHPAGTPAGHCHGSYRPAGTPECILVRPLLPTLTIFTITFETNAKQLISLEQLK